jgi:hypothetical protein
MNPTKPLYRFYVTNDEGDETHTLGILYAKNDEDCFAAADRLFPALVASYGETLMEGVEDGDEEGGFFFSCEALEDEDRLENALQDLDPQAEIHAVALHNTIVSLGAKRTKAGAFSAKQATRIATAWAHRAGWTPTLGVPL